MITTVSQKHTHLSLAVIDTKGTLSEKWLLEDNEAVMVHYIVM